MKSIVRAAFVASLLSSAATGIALAPAQAADAPKVSAAVGKPLSAAQKAVQAKDYPTALASIKDAQSAPDRTPFDDYKINSFLAYVEIQMNDYDAATAPAEAAADSPAMPDDEKKSMVFNAFQLSARAKQYQKTVAYGQELQAINALDPLMETILAQSYYFLNDIPHAEQYAQMSIDASKAAGQAPNQVALEIVMNGQAKQNNVAGVQSTLENLALNFDQTDAWSRLVDIALSTKGIKETDELFLLRLKFLIPDSMTGEDYMGLGSAANVLGYATEAYNVLQKGISSGKVTTGQAGPTYSQARNGAGLDERSLSKIASDAARAKTGEQDIKLAEDYWGYGRFADAEVAARRAIGKGGLKDPNEGPMLLGMLLCAQGKYDDAIQTLSSVSGSPARTNAAHLWSLYAQAQKKKAQGGSAQTPPPAQTAAPAQH